MSIEVKLPGLGDGIEEADVLEVLVKEGDRVEKDQGLVEVETDKATVQVPSSEAGVVKKIHVRNGDSIHIGAPIVTLEAESKTEAKAETKKAPPAEKPAKKKVEPAEAKANEQAKQPEPDAETEKEQRAKPAKKSDSAAAEKTKESEQT